MSSFYDINNLCRNGTFLIVFTPSALCLVFVIWKLILSILKLKGNTKIQSAIKILYYVSCIFGIIAITWITISSLLVCFPTAYSILGELRLVVFIGHAGLLTNIVITLLLRLYLTFQESVFKVSKYEIAICAILFESFA